jgi:hypothetical protein
MPRRQIRKLGRPSMLQRDKPLYTSDGLRNFSLFLASQGAAMTTQTRIFASPLRLAMLTAALLAATSCTGKTEYNYPDQKPGQRIDPTGSNKQYEGVLGQDGFNLFGRKSAEDQGGGIGVNSYLWRASLDSISFMPVSSADPFGGVIITDWYSPAETPDERFKLNIYILGRQLRADGIKAAVFRQRREPGGEWVDAAVEPKTVTELENAILTRARQMRIDTASP